MPDTTTKTLWYLIATLTTIVLSLVAAWGASTEARMDDHDKRLSAIERKGDRLETMTEMLLRAQGLVPPPKIKQIPESN
jgi:hypothetical protein